MLDWRNYIIYIGFLALFSFFAITLNGVGFLSVNNLLNIVRQTATVMIIATSMTFVIASAEIDLSVGAVAGLSSVTTAIAVFQWGFIPGILVGLATGIVIGSINGALVAILELPSFLVTLGTLGIAQGIALWISNSRPQPILNTLYLNVFGTGNLGSVPSLLIWTAVIVSIGTILLNKTVFGRHVLATGGGRLAAEFSGINTRKIKGTVLLLSGITASLAGMLYAGRLQSGRFEWGSGDELSAIAAVVLGGTSLFGGVGTVVGTLIGALMIGMINNALVLAGLNSSQQLIVRGVVIILAIAISKRK
jgi:ribose transport system permease protein